MTGRRATPTQISAKHTDSPDRSPALSLPPSGSASRTGPGTARCDAEACSQLHLHADRKNLQPRRKELRTSALSSCIADHELNASTFAGRVTAATLQTCYSAVTFSHRRAQGPLHGGANIDVMRMPLEIGEVSKVEAWLKRCLAKREKKISGFGHRVYHTDGSSCDAPAGHVRDLCESSGNSKWFAMSRMIERQDEARKEH